MALALMEMIMKKVAPQKSDKDLKIKSYADRTDAKENMQVQRQKILKGTAESQDVNKKKGNRPGFQKQVTNIASDLRINAQKRQGMY